MGRKNRRRPFQCPVAGCPKRGLRADLARHASAIHPNITRDAYLSALARGAMLGETKPKRRLTHIKLFWRLSMATSIACILLILALRLVANT